ncbi:MAG: carboxypeptidase regulatory-like domain-containing protein [Acidobacteria bacterium]|nr:carboxypeptidase regulatory-like domain-containing protein [Acidobacteriota bacterium]
MKTIQILGALGLVAAAVGLSCSGGKQSTDPTPEVVSMQGSVTLPSESALSSSDLSIGFGVHDSTVDEFGDFSIDGNGHVPGLAVASLSSGSPALMAIVPDPTEGGFVTVNAHTTAVALVFLHPFICTNNPEFIDGVLADIESLPQLAPLEAAVESTLTGPTLALDVENSAIAQALEAAVTAYVNNFTSNPAPGRAGLSPLGEQVDGIEINPNYQVGGLLLRWKGGSDFELTNFLGRWAYCTTPEDSFFVFPNGDFLDILKGSRPWAPQTRAFRMTVPPNTAPQEVHVYGYGFAGTKGNQWDSLTHSEQNLAHAGGIPTVLIELCSPMISIVTNTSVALGREEIAKRIGATVVGMILSQGTLMQQLGLYAKNHNPWGLSWTLSKWVMNELVSNSQFRVAFISATGMALTSASLGRLAAWLSVPAKVVMTFNSVSSTLKTAMGFTAAEFNTAFEVSRDVLESGSVRGQVADSISGSPISGAQVQLQGDDNNPLNPSHQVTTGADGTYYFSNIITGPKTITATKAGYAAKTINVTIEKDHEVTAHIPLARQSGGLSGKILNGIFVHYGIQPANFNKTLELEMRPAAGDASLYSNISNGTYTLTLAAGTWWLKAAYEDYRSDSIQVTIPTSGSIAAPRDLVLEPMPTMGGEIFLDMNNDGTNDQTIQITFPNVGLTAPTAWTCDAGSPQYCLAMGVRGSAQSDYDATIIGLKVSSITGAGAVSVGPFHEWPCSPQSGPAIAFISTTRQHCTAPDVTAPMSFVFEGDPDKPGCACGISNPGTVTLTDWGTQLGDLVAGWITVDLHGWTGCYCDASDTNHDGINDHYDVACARAHAQIDFRFLVGTDYLVPWVPTSPPYIPAVGADARSQK